MQWRQGSWITAHLTRVPGLNVKRYSVLYAVSLHRLSVRLGSSCHRVHLRDNGSIRQAPCRTNKPCVKVGLRFRTNQDDAHDCFIQCNVYIIQRVIISLRFLCHLKAATFTFQTVRCTHTCTHTMCLCPLLHCRCFSAPAKVHLGKHSTDLASHFKYRKGSTDEKT